MKILAPIALFCALSACSSSTASDPEPTGDTGSAEDTTPVAYLEAPAAGEGFQIAMDMEAAPYTEIWLCDVKAMPNTELAAVNRVEMQHLEERFFAMILVW